MLATSLLTAALALAATPPGPSSSMPPPPPPPGGDIERVEAAKRYLAAKYDDAVLQPNGSARMYGLAYLPWSKPPVPVAAEGLRRWLPQTRFYATELSTGYYEYRDVPVIVSVAPAAGGGLDVRSIVNPRYGDSSGKFLAQFGVPSVPEGERVAYARAIAELLTSTFDYTAGEPTTGPRMVTVPLKDEALLGATYRELTLFFHEGGPMAGTEVTLVNPRAGRPAGR